MKFNPQLKQALEALEKKKPEPPKPQPKPELPVIPFYKPREARQVVVGSDIIRTPVDKTARMVVAKAPWWAQPPDTPSEPIPKPLILERAQPVIKPQKPTVTKRKEQINMQSPNVQKTNHPAQQGGGTITSEKKPNDAVNAELMGEFIKRSTDAIAGIKTLVEQGMDARAALDILCDHWKPEWVQFIQDQDKRLQELRMARMAFDTETKILMAGLKDVRNFFQDKNHDAEVAKLREFVDLCERLKKLKDCGFLDTVADTLLKLSA